ncbi:MAG TPA: isoleucine--tRNA ligase [Patescibacteria group bacterium]|nr:isoleucine--tRNA ligase [Patescibacteria group bacterium]
MFKPVNSNVDFPALEHDLLKQWYEKGIVDKYLHRNDSSKKRFSFLDGPITANNPMGVHHAWGRTYKDLWQRFYNMRGFRQRFQNGFDCQGLWVEVEVEKELGLRFKKDIENIVEGDKKASIAKFVDLCKQRVLKYSGIQTEQSKRLGYFMNWDHSYYTMSDENNYMIWYFLKACFEKGWIYKGKDSVPWCPRCETAISQHEMLTEDYKEVVHEAIYIEFPIVGRKNEFLLVWTTTPWTIPGNIAVAVDKKLDYSLVEGMDGNLFWITKDRIETVFKKEYKRIVKTVKGKELVGLKYKGPFDDLEGVAKVAKANPETFHTVIETDDLIMPIATTEGTGLVHTAVSAGSEDFRLGKKLGLPMIPLIEDNASYLPGLDFLSGQNAKKHPEIIFNYLKQREEKGENWIFLIERYKHRYPACWRCKTELVWKVADEWYISMDRTERERGRSPASVSETGVDRKENIGQKTKNNKQGKTLREQMVETAKMIEWHPDFGLERELDWLKNMHDWLISKPNRYWGLALPIFECKKCGEFEVIGSYEELKERAVEGWEKFEGHTPHKPFIDDVKIKCKKCGEIVSRINDVGNVWLDAGIVPFSTFVDPISKKLSYTSDKKYWQEWFPANLITESFPGQFKNWFYSMIAMSTVLEKRNPFEKVLGYASVLAEDGRPMHKSWGNAIEFNEGANKIGVDVMRWMYVNNDPEQNLLFGYKKADETRRRFHLMLWNIYNFFVLNANIDKWESDCHAELDLASSGFRVKHGMTGGKNVLDTWILSRLNNTINSVTTSLEQLQAQKAAQAIEEFVSDLSLWYIRRSRDRVGPTVEDGEDKQAFYQTCFEVLITLSKLIAPFMPFMSEEIYRNLTGEESVHLADWPEIDKEQRTKNSEFEEQMKLIRKIVEMGLAQRKNNQIKVRQPLRELRIMNKELRDNALLQLIKDELNVKEIVFEKGEGEMNVALDINISPELKAEGMARDIIRQIQEERKKLGTTLDEKVNVTLPTWPKEFESYIKSQALVENLEKGEEFKVNRI